ARHMKLSARGRMASPSSSARGSARIEGWRYERWTGSCPHERRHSQRLASDFVVVWSCGHRVLWRNDCRSARNFRRQALAPQAARPFGRWGRCARFESWFIDEHMACGKVWEAEFQSRPSELATKTRNFSAVAASGSPRVHPPLAIGDALVAPNLPRKVANRV